jgi:hypothetical protein
MDNCNHRNKKDKRGKDIYHPITRECLKIQLIKAGEQISSLKKDVDSWKDAYYDLKQIVGKLSWYTWYESYPSNSPEMQKLLVWREVNDIIKRNNLNMAEEPVNPNLPKEK